MIKTGPISPVLTLFVADFSALALGQHTAADILTRTGVTYTRTGSAGVSIQTSASTLTTDIPNTADVCCIGDGGFGRGAICEDTSTNIISGGKSCRNMTAGGGWTAGSGGVAYTNPSGTVSPDGNSLATTIAASAGTLTSNYNLTTVAAARVTCWSLWLQGNYQPIEQNSGSSDGHAKAGNIGAWARIDMNAVSDGGATYCAPLNTSNLVAQGGGAAGARTCVADCAQVDSSGFPLEFKNGSGATRSQDKYQLASAATVVNGGGITSVFKMVMKNASTAAERPNAQTYYYLWAMAANNFARVVIATGILEIKNGGATFSSGVAINWSRYDTLEIFTAIGPNATIAKYRLNGGAAIDLVPGSTAGAIVPGGAPLYLLSSSAPDSPFWCWFQTATFYYSGNRPSWA